MAQLIARFSRRFSTFKPQRHIHFDPAKDITSDIVLFKNEKSTKSLKYLFIFAGLNFAFWLLPSVGGLRYLNDFVTISNRRKKYVEEGVLERELWETLIHWIDHHRMITSAFLASVACSGFFLVAFYSSRSVRKITILKGGQIANLQTWLPIPMESYSNEMVVPVTNISALNTRNDNQNFLRLKVKGFPFHFLMDKYNGVFVNPVVFDKTIAFNRVLK